MIKQSDIDRELQHSLIAQDMETAAARLEPDEEKTAPVIAGTSHHSERIAHNIGLLEQFALREEADLELAREMRQHLMQYDACTSRQQWSLRQAHVQRNVALGVLLLAAGAATWVALHMSWFQGRM